jgi:hypothetical protein
MGTFSYKYLVCYSVTPCNVTVTKSVYYRYVTPPPSLEGGVTV